jgi:AcrR family transcriptional regulator
MSCKPECLGCEYLRRSALEIIAAVGVEGLSTEALARQAGLASREVLRHYATATDCLYATYDEVADDVLRDLVDAFAEIDDWQSAFELSVRRLVERLAADPGEARLCFGATVGSHRELRRRRDHTRGWVVQFLARERALREGEAEAEHERERHALQIELLIGAGFHVIASAVADREPADLAELESKLAVVAGSFIPARV